uniref:Facilitated trehalose transporter Tret1like [Nasonia vitripennis] n=1 Tax=Lepeophtheirus salmonis TaxID=72036 RepID=A0A0K2U1S5_LEPSM
MWINLQPKSALFRQTLAAILIGAIPGMAIGTVLGYSAVMLPRLGSKFSLEEKSWIASITAIFPIFSCFMAGILAQKIGRKISLLIFLSLTCTGWIILPFAKESFALLMVSRIFQGFGIILSLLQLYLVEISELRNRDLNCSFPSIFVNIGITVIYIADTLIDDWSYVAVFGAGCTALSILLIILCGVPESPYWLIQIGRTEDAIKNLEKLRDLDSIPQEIDNITETIKNNGKMANSFKEQIQELNSLEVLKPLMILLIVGSLSQATGQYAVAFYAVDIIIEFLPNLRNEAYYTAIGVGLLRVIASILGIFFIKKFKRRSLLMSHSFMMGLCLFAISAIVGLKPFFRPEIVASRGWVFQILPLVLLSLYSLFFGLGVNLIPYLLVGELCPSKIKNLTSSLSIGLMSISIFTVVKIFPTLLATIGCSMTYLFYGSFCMGLAIFTYCCVPETSNKSLQELQGIFRKEIQKDTESSRL